MRKVRKAPVARVTTAKLRKQLDDRTLERDEALEQLAATSEVLKVISGSHGELEPVFQSILAQPTVAASTRDLGDRVEIRIRDNGTGIAPDVKDRMFNPFFTTKPSGQGTGLGLSISHDIIVKQHAGVIEVDTQPGEFTEIRVILPRSAVFV